MAITISGENNNDKILASDGVIDQISGFSIVGVVTATSFTGDLTGNVTGNLTGNVNSTSPLLLQTGGSERFRITGNNELGIAGANYGSAGQVLTSGGSGSAVTWSAIPSQVNITSNADNRVITGGSGVNLNGEANLTYDGSKLVLAANSTAYDAFQVGNGLFIGNTTNNVSAAIFHQGGGADLEIGSQDMITFTTGSTAGNATERLRINSYGQVGVNTTVPGAKFGIAVDSNNTNALATGGIALGLKNTNTTDNSWVCIDFNNSVGGIVGRIGAQFKDTSDKDTDLYFATRADGGSLAEALRITSDGNIGIGIDPDSTWKTHIRSSTFGLLRLETTLTGADASYLEFYHNSSSPADDDELGVIQFKGKNDASQDHTYAYMMAKSTDVSDGSEDGDILFATAGNGTTAERLRITSGGHTLFKGDGTGGNSALGGFGTHTWTPKVQVLHDQGQAIIRDGNEVWGGALHLAKCRGTYASPSAAANNDRAGAVYFEAHDGADFLNYVAGIECYLDGTVASNDTPGRLVFSTTADGGANSLTERLRITSSGRVNIGDSYATGTDLNYCRLNVYGQTTQGGTDENLNLLNVYNYGSGNPGNITGIGLGAGAGPDYTKASLAFVRNDSYGRGDLIFCINAAGNSDLVTKSDEHLRLTKTGALALGQSASSLPQENSGHYHQLQIGLGAHFYGRTDDTNIFLGSNAHRYGTAWRYTASTTASLISMGTNIEFSTAGNGTAGNTISFTDRLKIAASGVVEVKDSNFSAFATSSSLYGATSANSKGFYYDRGTASAQSSSPRNTGWSSYYINKHDGNGGGENRYIDFWLNGGQIGNITLNGSNNGVNYNQTSDYRLKKDDVVMTDGIARVKQLRPIKFKWIKGDIDSEGFFAHEVQTVVPIAVEGTKDQVVLQSEVDAGTQQENKSAGDPIYQSMDNSKLVPVLTAALKEAIDRIETLEAKVAALEGS